MQFLFSSTTTSLFKCLVCKINLLQNLHEGTVDESGKSMYRKAVDGKLDNDRSILISYLAAISQFPKNLFDSLKLLSEVRSSNFIV